MKNKEGFTLAEVLITLAVIGIVASLTIPAIYQNIQHAELKTAFKRDYSVIAQAISRAAADNGGTIKDLCNDSDHPCFLNIFMNYLGYIKYCPAGQTLGNCWHNGNTWTSLNGNLLSGWDWGQPEIILSNGALIFPYSFKKACNGSYGFGNVVCGEIFIDINGFKGPNTVGRDIFYLWVLENSIKPGGIQGDSNEGNCQPANTTLNGWGCAAKVIMNQDY